MARTQRDFSKREAVEQEAALKDTWCNACNKADLGMVHPVEFEEDGQIIVEGLCARCGAPIRTRLIVEGS
jgi:RNase P subunit RPR2